MYNNDDITKHHNNNLNTGFRVVYRTFQRKYGIFSLWNHFPHCSDNRGVG